MDDKRKLMEERVAFLNKAARVYYQESNEIISNQEYDRLYDELEAMEKETGIVLSNSPTVNVGYQVVSGLPKERHPSPMLSLDKTKEIDQLKSWLGDKEGVLSWKLDGLTIVLTYEDGRLTKAVTRGDGVTGEVITNNARVFDNIPLTIPYKASPVVVRGEAVISYDDFREINTVSYTHLDVISVEKIMGLANDITPGFKTIGALYNSSETNSVSAIEDLKEYAEANNLKVVESAITSANEIQPAAQNLAKKCDIVFSPTDNTVASAIATANSVFIESKIPFYVGADSMVKDGAFATYGVDYEYLGQETAKMIVEIINGADPAQMPVRTMDEMAIYINSQTAKDMGIEIPEEILEQATDLAKEDL